ncbi:hypothetical protein glysoja_029264 [Glycine soja]|uniref:Uncharacterized protein n=1 Tax=Glycine soja TaxID=3848 RepID=A0A0B2SMI7_GLYSO|nr:hypothetical protein glysoja_029264 [Glycine soja]
MKSVTKTAEGKPPQHGPQWIEAKSHVQTGNYECGYMTTLRHKWAAYFIQMKKCEPRKN